MKTRHTLPLRLLALILLPLAADAYEVRLEPRGPAQVTEGRVVVFDVVLDTQGQSDIRWFHVGLTFDPSLFAYEPSLSASNDELALYAPPAGKGPGTWLEPIANPPAIWPVAPFDQVAIAFRENSLASTTGTASDLVLATLAFRAGSTLGPGSFDIGFTHSDAIFRTTAGDVLASVSTPGSTAVTIIAAPAVPGLAPIGLGATAATIAVVGAMRSWRRRSRAD